MTRCPVRAINRRNVEHGLRSLVPFPLFLFLCSFSFSFPFPLSPCGEAGLSSFSGWTEPIIFPSVHPVRAPTLVFLRVIPVGTKGFEVRG